MNNLFLINKPHKIMNIIKIIFIFVYVFVFIFYKQIGFSNENSLKVTLQTARSGMTLFQILNELNKQIGHEKLLCSKEIQNITFDVDIKNKSLEEALRLLVNSYNIKDPKSKSVKHPLLSYHKCYDYYIITSPNENAFKDQMRYSYELKNISYEKIKKIIFDIIPTAKSNIQINFTPENNRLNFSSNDINLYPEIINIINQYDYIAKEDIQTQSVNISGLMTLKTFFDKVQKQTGWKALYYDRNTKNLKDITIEVNFVNVHVLEALNELKTLISSKYDKRYSHILEFEGRIICVGLKIDPPHGDPTSSKKLKYISSNEMAEIISKNGYKAANDKRLNMVIFYTKNRTEILNLIEKYDIYKEPYELILSTEDVNIQEKKEDFIARNYPSYLSDSKENEIGLIMIQKALEYCKSKEMEYTSSILLLNKVIKGCAQGKLGRPKIMYNLGVATTLGKCYAYYYRNNIYDFAIVLKAYRLYEQKKFEEAKFILMDYINTIEANNMFSEDYMIDFINDEEFMNYYRKHINDETEIKFAYEISQRKNEDTFTIISSNRPDKMALIMLLSIFIIQNEQQAALKTMNIIKKYFNKSLKSEWLEPYFNMKKEMLFDTVTVIISQYISWNVY